MIQVGQWTGHYCFKNKKFEKINGFEKTFFDIEILTINDNTFTGKVQDDLTSGGTAGVGEILGKIKGDRIDFVKSMPVMTLVVDKKGSRKTYNKKHFPIFYTGRFSNDGQTVSGTWRFKLGFIWIGIIPIPIIPCSGVWSMTKKY